MKYFVDYQYMPKDSARPIDQGEVMPLEIGTEADPSILPSVGDYIQITNSEETEGRASFSGKVRSRLFRYFGFKSESTCAVTIVVEQSDDDWGELVKE